MSINAAQQKDILIKLANYRMPFGQHEGQFLLNIPESYFAWFSHKGFPDGELGEYMAMMLEIKTNGLEYLLNPLRNS